MLTTVSFEAACERKSQLHAVTAFTPPKAT